jgi:sulfide:quinone oxidoreductase
MSDPSAPGVERPQGSRLRVVIAGGGVAALEAMLALRELAGDRVTTRLLAPDPVFRYRPLSVTEPFGASAPRNLELAQIAVENHATFSRDGLETVDADARRVRTTSGREIDYDALLLAIGARGTEGLPGAIAFRDSADQGSFGEVLAELERGAVRRLAFAVPAGASWPLGLYELALLTSAHARDRGLEDVELTLVTPEPRPLAVFGRRASAVVARLLEQAGVGVRVNKRPLRFTRDTLEIEGADSLRCDHVISLPLPEVDPIPGIPQQLGGFIPVDRYGGVLGAERVFAAGDVTWFPIKQGGLATQQADCVAHSIAALAGAPVEPQVFRPVLRGALLTEGGPRYMRATIDEGESTAARSTLWWPPAKVAGRYLAPYLMAKAGYGASSRPLEDLNPPPTEDAAGLASGHEDAVGLALSSADATADERDFGRALRWLEVAEDLELYLPREYELKRISWQELAAGDAPRTPPR